MKTLFILLTFFTSAPVLAEKWVAIAHPGANWIHGKPWDEQDLKAHGEYHADLFKKKKVLFGGPFLDSQGGLVVFEVASEAELNGYLSADPAVIKGVFIYEHHPWYPVFGPSL